MYDQKKTVVGRLVLTKQKANFRTLLPTGKKNDF